MSCASFVFSCDCGVLIFTIGNLTITAERVTYSESFAHADLKRTPAFHTIRNTIRRVAKGFRRRIGLTSSSDVLFVLNSPRGPLEVQGNNL
jgi:hypothetical protein